MSFYSLQNFSQIGAPFQPPPTHTFPGFVPSPSLLSTDLEVPLWAEHSPALQVIPLGTLPQLLLTFQQGPFCTSLRTPFGVTTAGEDLI